MSQIYFKFKAAKDFDTATFDGTSISAFDLKRQIMLSKKLGKGTDFDLVISNAQSGEVYDNDMALIPRNTQILVARQPPAGRQGTAQRYVSAAIIPPQRPAPQFQQPMFTAKTLVNVQQKSMAKEAEFNPPTEELTEEERIQKMFKQSEVYWASQEKILAHQRPIMRTSRPGTGPGARPFRPMPEELPARTPPPGYICFRCGDKGHYISHCPTIGNSEFDNRPRIKRTTGIPKMFLKTVEDKSQVNGGLMITQDGEFVVAQPNDQAWIKYAKKRQNAGHGDINEKTNVPSELKCAICMRLMVDAVKVPCCQANFCDDCIRTSLVENEDPTMRFRCPVCRVDQFPDNLLDNKEIRQKVDQLLKSYFSQEGPKSASKLESPPVDNVQSTMKKNHISTGPMMIPTAQRKGRSYTIVEPLEKSRTPELGDGNHSGASSKQNSSPSTDQESVKPINPMYRPGMRPIRPPMSGYYPPYMPMHPGMLPNQPMPPPYMYPPIRPPPQQESRQRKRSSESNDDAQNRKMTRR